MEQYLYYLLRATVTATLFYGVYKLLFSKTTFYASNRIALMLILVSILTVPLFRYDFLPKNEEKTAQVLELESKETTFVVDNIAGFPITENQVENMPDEPQTQPVEIPWMKILSILYFMGVTFFLVRYAIGLVRLREIIRNAKTKYRQADGSVICIADKEIAPFSWFKYIVLSEQDYTDENKVIIKHEQAHVRLRHSVDRLFYDLMLCLFWFNPFSWLLRRELQSVHEFQADEAVITQGVDAKKYQLLLIRKSVGETKFAMANSFLQRDLQKRISMMMKNKTKSTMKWGYVLLFPLLALTMLVLSVPKLNATVTEENLDLPSEILTETNVVNQNQSLMVDEKEKPLVIINGEEQDENFDLNSLPADSIASISVLKDKSAIAAYGKKGKNGVVLIITKKNNDLSKKTSLYIIDGKKSKTLDSLTSNEFKLTIMYPDSAKLINGMDFISSNEAKKDADDMFVVIDGKPQSENFDLNTLDESKISSVRFITDSKAVSLYGERARNVVCLITTKGHKEIIPKVNGKELRGVKMTKTGVEFNADDIPLTILDGQETNKLDFSLLPKEEGSSSEYRIEILPSDSAELKYGTKGKKGAIIITKKNKQNPYGIKKANIKKAPNDYSKTAFVVEDKLVGEVEALAIAPDKIERITKIADGDELKKLQKKFKTDKTYFMVIELK